MYIKTIFRGIAFRLIKFLDFSSYEYKFTERITFSMYVLMLEIK